MNSKVFCLSGLLLFVFLVPVNGFATIRHVCFVVNPASNNGKGARVWDRIEEAVNLYYTAVGSQDQAAAQEQATFEVFFTENAGHATYLAVQAYEDWQQGQHAEEDQLLLVAVGGDGTVREVVQGLASEPQVVIGVIPAGKGNDIARTLKLCNPMHALRSLVYGASMPFGAYKIEGCQTGSCEKQTVLAVSGFNLGVTTQMTKNKNDHDSGERPSRLLRYSPRSMASAMLAISSAMRWNTPMVRCTSDKGRFNIPLNFLAASTGPTFGGGIALFNYMKPFCTRGKVLYSQQRMHPIWTFIQMTIGRLLNWSGLVWTTMERLRNWSGQRALVFTQLDIEHQDETPLSIQVDGDILLQTPAKITWLPFVLRFMGPPKYGEPGYSLMGLEQASDDPDSF
ncbi:diacylglycerol kinase family protein [Endozoicomonas sp. SESOKO3]|uniref:diacylglycerol/lipid kinase family protein n=1 Tax=Endozoicomonas sp. SESOKO3 TaxID=2828744 RepID=UPI00214799C3